MDTSLVLLDYMTTSNVGMNISAAIGIGREIRAFVRNGGRNTTVGKMIDGRVCILCGL